MLHKTPSIFEKFDMSEYIRAKLSQFGYDSNLVENLLKTNNKITLESAIYALSKNLSGKWNHSFIGLGKPNCDICSDTLINHSTAPNEITSFYPATSVDKICQVCYSPIQNYDEMILLSCGHSFCETCLREYL